MDIRSAFETTLAGQAFDTHHCAEAEVEDIDNEFSEHQVLFDDQLGINDEYVLDIVETKKEKYNREVLRRAGWLKEEREARPPKPYAMLQQERIELFNARRAQGLPKFNIVKGN